MDKIRATFPYVIIVIMLIAGAWHVLTEHRGQPGKDYVDAPPAKAVADVTERLPVKGTVNVLPPSVKRKLGLPQTDQNDPQIHVVDTASFPITTQPFTAVAIYDESTGDVSTHVREEPLPWLAAERRWYARLGGGVKTRTGRVGQVAIGGTFVQVKSWHIGGGAELFTDGEGYLGAYAEYQF